MKSIKNGTNTLVAEITNVSQHGFWIYYSGKEYFASFSDFPWFKDHPLSSLFNFSVDKSGHFYWPDIDVDLSVDILENPEKYPLIAKH